MVACLLRLAFASWIILESKIHGLVEPSINYKIHDGLGEESSFIYENGRIQIDCAAHTSTPNAEVTLFAELPNSKTKELTHANGNFTFNVSLNIFEYKALYCYSGSMRSEILTITYRMCNPMLLKPPISTCKDEEVCLYTTTKTSACKKTNELKCRLEKEISEKNLPKEKFVCIKALETPTETSLKRGLCTAIVEKNQPFSGISAADATACTFYHHLKLDGEIAEQGSLWSKPISNKILEVEFVKITSIFEEASCQMRSMTSGAIHLVSALPTNIKQVKGESILSLSIDLLHSTAALNLPMKFELTCAVNDTREKRKSTSAYLILIDETQFNLSITKTHIEKDLYSLKCSAKRIEGIEITVSWDKEPTTYVERTSANKTVTNVFDDVKQVHTCYSVGYVYQYPYKAGLKKLPIPTLQKSIDIKRAVITPTNNKGSGNETNGNDKNANNNQNKDQNTTKSDKLATTIGVVLGLIVVFIVIAIIAFFTFNYVRKRPNNKFLLICRKDKLHGVNILELEHVTKELMEKTAQCSLEHTTLDKCLEKCESFKRYKDEIEELREISPPDTDVGYLATTRYPTKPIVRHTWTNKDNQKCHLDNNKPTARSSSDIVEGLHMNTITDCKYKDAYIASSAPMPHEFPLFYETLFEKKVSMIVCFVNEVPTITITETVAEKKTNKTKNEEMDVYWNCKTKKEFKGYDVLTRDMNSIQDREMREIDITKKSTGETVVVRHLLFREVRLLGAFVDVFSYSTVFSYVKMIQSEVDPTGNKLVLVNCINGIDRTGLFISVALGIQFLEVNGLPLNLYQIVKKFQSERADVVNNLVQYVHSLFEIANYWIAKFPNHEYLTYPPGHKRGLKSQKRQSILKTSTKVGFAPKVQEQPISLVGAGNPYPYKSKRKTSSMMSSQVSGSQQKTLVKTE